ncbi:hypothetical protein BaRGS_00005353 [Batillaria attramentaria]|uniref:Uncharacterized protein n=1 Tax=Batillaria attramentaria TaxID=370345 RepID=A0ABD0LVA0_9CAEN
MGTTALLMTFCVCVFVCPTPNQACPTGCTCTSSGDDAHCVGVCPSAIDDNAVTKLHLSNCHCGARIERSAFRHLTNLRELEIKSCGYTSIFDNAFADTQLTKLDLGGTVDWQCDCDSLWLAKFLAGSLGSVSPRCSLSTSDLKNSVAQLEATCPTSTTTTTESANNDDTASDDGINPVLIIGSVAGLSVVVWGAILAVCLIKKNKRTSRQVSHESSNEKSIDTADEQTFKQDHPNNPTGYYYDERPATMTTRRSDPAISLMF